MKPSTTKIALAAAFTAVAAAAVAIAATSGVTTRSAISREAMQTYAAMTMPLAAAERRAAAAMPTKDVTLVIKSDEEHARKGPEGEWHDAFLPARFTVRPGQRVNVTAYNYDEGDHSFTSPTMGLNVTLPGGTEKAPHRSTFSFVAPAKAGSYEWFCAFPCDPWAMGHTDYMHGYVTVSA